MTLYSGLHLPKGSSPYSHQLGQPFTARQVTSVGRVSHTGPCPSAGQQGIPEGRGTGRNGGDCSTHHRVILGPCLSRVSAERWAGRRAQGPPGGRHTWGDTPGPLPAHITPVAPQDSRPGPELLRCLVHGDL